MEERILIFQDRTNAAQFKKEIKTVMTRCNALIEVYQAFQDWETITTHEQWIELVTDPVSMMNKTILDNIEIRATGGKQPSPAILGQMFGIEYENYLNMVTGHPVAETDCLPCQKVRMKPGSKAISLSDYRRHQEYLIFASGSFVLNDAAIQEQLNAFDTYIDKPEQIELYKHFQELARIVNDHARRGYFSTVDLEAVAKMSGLRYVHQTREVYINEENLRSEILKIK